MLSLVDKVLKHTNQATLRESIKSRPKLARVSIGVTMGLYEAIFVRDKSVEKSVQCH